MNNDTTEDEGKVTDGRKPFTTTGVARGLLAVLAAILLLSACATPLQWANIDPAELESLGSGQWLSDLRALRDGMSKHPKMNGDPATRARFDAALREAENAIAGIRAPDSGKAGASLSDTAVAGIMKAVAAMGDGHTRLNTSFRTLYPAAMRFFSREGGWDLVLAAAAPAWGSYVGMTVAKIGGRDIPEAAAIVSEYLSLESGLAHEDLRDHAIRTEIMDYFMNPPLMRAVGLADGEGLCLEFEGGESCRIAETERGNPWVRVLDRLEETPFTRSRPDDDWWAGTVPGHPDILYFRYDSCVQEAWPTMRQTLDMLPSRGQSGQGSIRRLIVDLRYNSGGDSRPGTRFARALEGKEVSTVEGGVIVLVGGMTYSSAMQNAADIVKACGGKGASSGNAILVGEPLVEPLDHYGEVKKFLLPASGIVVGRSSRFWPYARTTGLSPARGVLEPTGDNIVLSTFSDYSHGIDAAFGRAATMTTGR